MKKITLLAVLITLVSVINKTEAQVRFGVSLNIGAPVYAAPAYNAPVYNADDYYYYPDIDMYFSIALGQYIYFDGYRWINTAYVPYAYRGYDFNHLRRVNIHEARPYLHADVYRERYANNSYAYNNYRPAERFNDHDRDDRFRRDADHDRDRFSHEREHGWRR